MKTTPLTEMLQGTGPAPSPRRMRPIPGPRRVIARTCLGFLLLLAALPLLPAQAGGVSAREAAGHQRGAVERFVGFWLSPRPQPVGPLLTLEPGGALDPMAEGRELRSAGRTPTQTPVEEDDLIGARSPLPSPADTPWTALLRPAAAAVKLFVQIALQLVTSLVIGLP